MPHGVYADLLTALPSCSRNWGFTPYSRDDYLAWKKEGRLVSRGVHATLLGAHGSLAARDPSHLFATPARRCQIPLHPE